MKDALAVSIENMLSVVFIPKENKLEYLKRALVNLYNDYLTITPQYIDGKDKEILEPYTYKQLYKIIVENYPELGLYEIVLHPLKFNQEIAIGDAVDDLTDIVRDMLEVKAYLEVSDPNATWHFHFLMQAHTEQHLVDLLKYLKDIEE